jgi:hypothetical protein
MRRERGIQSCAAVLITPNHSLAVRLASFPSTGACYSAPFSPGSWTFINGARYGDITLADLTAFFTVDDGGPAEAAEEEGVVEEGVRGGVPVPGYTPLGMRLLLAVSTQAPRPWSADRLKVQRKGQGATRKVCVGTRGWGNGVGPASGWSVCACICLVRDDCVGQCCCWDSDCTLQTVRVCVCGTGCVAPALG